MRLAVGAAQGWRTSRVGSADDNPRMAALIEALHQLVAAIEGRRYTYEEINVKRWVPDADACELCEDNADMDWIEDDAVFEGVFGEIDGPPAHPHCGCELEYGVKRKRVYD